MEGAFTWPDDPVPAPARDDDRDDPTSVYGRFLDGAKKNDAPSPVPPPPSVVQAASVGGEAEGGDAGGGALGGFNPSNPTASIGGLFGAHEGGTINGRPVMTNDDGEEVGVLGIRTETEHKNNWMKWPGMVIGGIIGTIFGGQTGLGMRAGKHAGSDFGDLLAGNWEGIGASFQDNLPGVGAGAQGPGFNPSGMMGGSGGGGGFLSGLGSMFSGGGGASVGEGALEGISSFGGLGA